MHYNFTRQSEKRMIIIEKMLFKLTWINHIILSFLVYEFGNNLYYYTWDHEKKENIITFCKKVKVVSNITIIPGGSQGQEINPG